jgi:hypothetical protein
LDSETGSPGTIATGDFRGLWSRNTGILVYQIALQSWFGDAHGYRPFSAETGQAGSLSHVPWFCFPLVRRFPRTASINDWHRRSLNSPREICHTRVPLRRNNKIALRDTYQT